VSLIDFGLGTFFDEQTKMVDAVGCINYASPALLRLTNSGYPFAPAKGHSDLWAVGVLAHGLLTGFFPFRAEEPVELAAEIARAAPLEMDASELAHGFLSTVLDPRNEGRLTAEMLLAHPWLAPFAPAQTGSLAPVAPPKILSSPLHPLKGVQMATAALESILPRYLDSIAPHHDDDGASLFEGSADTFSKSVSRTGSDGSFSTLRGDLDTAPAPFGYTMPARVSQPVAIPTKKKLSTSFNVGRWFEKLKAGGR
jgi:serine/threonine protein kinase